MTIPSVRRPSAALAVLTALLVALLLSGCGTTEKEAARSNNANALYAEARDDIASGAFDRAIKNLQRVEALATGTLLGQQATLELAYAYWRTGERAQALATLDRFIRLHPSSPALDYALYLRGLANFNDNLGVLSSLSRQDITERDQRASREAYQSFAQLVQRFPNSRYAEDARVRMDFIVNSLAAYEVHVARYYFRRGAFLAAANRAQQAVAEYQNSPAAEEALFLMAQSYDRLQLPELRDAAARVLRASFPESPYLRPGAALPQRGWWQLW
jgi:outer membrane protein assembly factor BamD